MNGQNIIYSVVCVAAIIQKDPGRSYHNSTPVKINLKKRPRHIVKQLYSSKN